MAESCFCRVDFMWFTGSVHPWVCTALQVWCRRNSWIAKATDLRFITSNHSIIANRLNVITNLTPFNRKKLVADGSLSYSHFLATFMQQCHFENKVISDLVPVFKVTTSKAGICVLFAKAVLHCAVFSIVTEAWYINLGNYGLAGSSVAFHILAVYEKLWTGWNDP